MKFTSTLIGAFVLGSAVLAAPINDLNNLVESAESAFTSAAEEVDFNVEPFKHQESENQLNYEDNDEYRHHQDDYENEYDDEYRHHEDDYENEYDDEYRHHEDEDDDDQIIVEVEVDRDDDRKHEDRYEGNERGWNSKRGLWRR